MPLKKSPQNFAFSVYSVELLFMSNFCYVCYLKSNTIRHIAATEPALC